MARFEKGQSGNPGGRPKENIEVRELAREQTARAVERLVFWLNSDNAKASVAAAQVLLDRGWGKAVQHIESKAVGRYVVRIPEKQPDAGTWLQKHAPLATVQ